MVLTGKVIGWQSSLHATSTVTATCSGLEDGIEATHGQSDNSNGSQVVASDLRELEVSLDPGDLA